MVCYVYSEFAQSYTCILSKYITLGVYPLEGKITSMQHIFYQKHSKVTHFFFFLIGYKVGTKVRISDQIDEE